MLEKCEMYSRWSRTDTAGECVDTKPSDFIGVSKGDTVSKTKAVMEQAKGNVLLIDEAYDLDPDAIT